MKTIPINDQMTQITERAAQRDFEKFKREPLELARRQREAKERRNKESANTEKPRQAAEAPT